MTTTPNSSYNYKTQRQQHTTHHITIEHKDNSTLYHLPLIAEINKLDFSSTYQGMIRKL